MAKKTLSKDDLQQIALNLKSTKSSQRRKAAIDIRKFHISKLGKELLNSYLEERKDQRTWDTQVAMIQSLGAIRYKEILPYIKEMIVQNKRLDMLTFVSALSYARLQRKNKKDIEPVLELLKNGDLSVLCGATASLAFDEIVPSESDIQKLIDIIEKIDITRLYEKGVHDPRSYFISAMSKWDISLTKPYLEQFKEDTNLGKYVKATYQGKKSRIE